MLFSKAFDDIGVDDVRELIAQGVRERRNLEYKSEAWGNTDSQIREMLKDISSMANAFGGYIFIGIKEDNNGAPLNEMMWLADDAAETERDRINAACVSSIEPRIPGLKVGLIQESGQGSLIKIFIPRSTRRPHMILKDSYRFYIRHDRQISCMSIEEIRDSCLRTHNMQTSVVEFIKRRRSDLEKTVGDSVLLVVGAAPISIGSSIVDISDSVIRGFLKDPPTTRVDGFNMKFRDSGLSEPFLAKPTISGLRIGTISWRQVELMRNGYYELIVKCEGEQYLTRVHHHEGRVISHLPLVEHTVNYFRALTALVQLLGIEETVVSFLCLYNAGNYGFTRYQGDVVGSLEAEVLRYDKPHLVIKPVELEHFRNPDEIALDFLGRIWNAYGLEVQDVPFFEARRFVYQSNRQ